MPPPEDAEQVLKAVRLGWAVAEVRGRNRPHAPHGDRAGLPPAAQPIHALPLDHEQTPVERRLMAQRVLVALARDLSVNSDANQVSYSEAIEVQAHELARARESDAAAGEAAPGGVVTPEGAAVPGEAIVPGPGVGDPAAQWDALQELIFQFDAHIRYTLAPGSDTVAYGYQLGRALAEPYWALSPYLDTKQSPEAFQFLLSPSRCEAISQLVGDLSAYFPPYAAAAVAGLARVWQHVAADKTWRSNGAGYLYRQIHRWYALTVVGRDPMTFVQPYARVRGVMPRVIRYYGGQLTLLVVGIAALVALVSLLSSGTGGALLSVVLGLVGAAGISAGSLSAGRLRQSLNADMAALAATIAPPAPSVARSRQKAMLTKMVRERPSD